MADKINWLPAAAGAALGAIATLRLPNVNREVMVAAALTGAAVGYGIADYIEDRSLRGRVRRARNALTSAASNARETVFNLPKRAAKAARDLVLPPKSTPVVNDPPAKTARERAVERQEAREAAAASAGRPLEPGDTYIANGVTYTVNRTSGRGRSPTPRSSRRSNPSSMDYNYGGR